MSHNPPNLKLIAVFAVPLLLVTALLQASKRYVDVLEGDEDLEILVAQAKAAGYPFSASELAIKDVPDNNNGYLVLKKLFMDPKNPAPKKPPEFFDEKLLNDPNRPFEVVELVERAKKVAAKTQFDAKHDYDQPYDDNCPEYAAIKEVVKALSFDAQFMARHGKVDKSIQSLRLARNIPHQLSDDPTQLGMLVSVACQAIYYSAVGKVAYELKNDPRALEELLRVVEVEVPVSTSSQNRYHDFYCALAVMRNYKSNSVVTAAQGFDEVVTDSELAPQVVRDGLPKNAINRVILAKTIRRFLEFDTVLAKNPDPITAVKAMDDLAINAPQTMSETMVGIMSPIYVQSEIARKKPGVYQELTRWSIEILLAHPKGLPDTLPPRPDKHFGGNLHYSKKDIGFYVYSTSADKKDSGGPVDDKTWERGDDFGLNVPGKKVESQRPLPPPGTAPTGSPQM